MNIKEVRKEMQLGSQTLVLETGKLAQQANCAVLATLGGTIVLATAVAVPATEEPSWFPLRVDYEEKLYAGGLIKSSRFIKREGRTSDEAIISGRLIDHALRPLFPKDYMDDTQIIVTVLQVDSKNNPELLGLIAANAALAASNIPFNGPAGSVHVGLDQVNKTVFNPFLQDKKTLKANLTISFLKGKKVLAMEGDFHQIPETKLFELMTEAEPYATQVIDFINDFAKEVGNEKYEYKSFKVDGDTLTEVKAFAFDKIKTILEKESSKIDFNGNWNELQTDTFKHFEGKYSKSIMSKCLEELQKDAIRKLIIEDKKRPDGRSLDEIRPLSAQVGLLNRTHGSAVFNRGITQVLTVATLGAPSLEQTIQDMYGESTKQYFHHYNTPPFTYGQTGPLRGPGRRDIGHGTLAEKALEPVLPDKKDFAYTIRVVSEVLSSNGSTSMASTCGSTLSLMDAGVPIKAPVAGIGVGLIVDEDKEWGETGKYMLLTDMQGAEDANGFMDFKLTGTRTGATALQMDIKTGGLPLEIFKDVLERSRIARNTVLDVMDKVLSAPRVDLSELAPRIKTIQIDKEQIGLLIGPGGKTIRNIIETSGATVDVNDDGLVSVSAVNKDSLQMALTDILGLTKTFEVGEIIEDAEVDSVVDFGAFVKISRTKTGLLHVSEISNDFLKDPREKLKEGDKIRVKVIKVDGEKVSLSKKQLEEKTEQSK